jgi:hypothetical protein
MAWSGSAIFREWPKSIYGQGQTAAVLPAGYAGLGADTVNVALFSTTPTPDKDAALTSTGYNTGVWTTGNELSDTNWAAGGRTLASKTFTTPSTGVFRFDAADLAGGGNVTITATHGCLVYDFTITAGTGGIAKQGISYHWFNGAQSVTAGTFTIIWHANGINQYSV